MQTLVDQALDARRLLPAHDLVHVFEEDGSFATVSDLDTTFDDDTLIELYELLVTARRFDTQAIALARQGRLAVYPSSRGQEAAQVGAVSALQADDWCFPTYRELVATVARGIDPVEALAIMRGSWHCGYDVRRWRTGPHTTPLATQALHAVGLADAARRKGDPIVALAFLGDGATSEGDAHEAFNFAAVFRAPCVFLVQNNHYAISVPLSRQTAAPSLAHKGIAYGMPGIRVDGNDILAVRAACDAAVHRARTGGGPTLIEAVTYRVEPHTTADDPSRYRTPEEAAAWAERDPLDRYERFLAARGTLTDAVRARAVGKAEAMAGDLRERMLRDDEPHPLDLFEHVYAQPTPRLARQRAALEAELAREGD